MPGLNTKLTSSPVSAPEQVPEQGRPGQAPEQEPVSPRAAEEAVTLPFSSHNQKKQR
jgi:hypothetical protein